jgi:hypothetical protein
MAYLGLQPQRKTIATSTQTLSGNGVDLEYSLNRAVSKAADILVFVGNTVQVPELHYTASDNTLLFATGNEPASGTDNISVSYKAGALSTVFVEANAYPVGSTTTPSIYSVDATSTGIYWPTTTSLGITVSGNTRVTVTDSPTATSTSSGALRVSGGAGISQALYVGGATRLVATTQSTNVSSGALVVSGGAGIAKDVFIGGGLQVSGDFTVAGQFTTTGSDSLILNDPFVFLANANPGDALDTGFISSYYDGFDNRYSGLFRDITDGKYKLFNNLLAQPTTTVDTGNVSFRYADLSLGNANITSTTSSTSSLTGALTVWGGIGARGTVYVNSQDNAIAIGNGGTGGVGNIGASGSGFNTAFVKSTSAQYADVAENYVADAKYLPGTVVSFGGDYEVTQSTADGDTRIAGVITTNPAYIMNDALSAEHVASVALLGRVPCYVQGTIAKGDMLVSAGNGRARAESNPKLGAVIGKALEDFDGVEGTIEVVVGKV